MYCFCKEFLLKNIAIKDYRIAYWRAYGEVFAWRSKNIKWLNHFIKKMLQTKWVKSEVTQSCQTLCNPMDCSPPGSPIHEIFQARVLEWVAISFSKEWIINNNLIQLTLLLLLFSRSVVSDSLQLCGLRHARLPCPSPSPRACSNSLESLNWPF